MAGPKILLLDIETAPILGYLWQLWDQTIAPSQVKTDWYVLSWSAKWFGAKEVMYQDQRKAKNLEDDSKLLRGIWELIDEADVLVTQNGVAFDLKKLNARFAINGFKPPSSVKHIDTKLLAKRHFGFTSNSLEYMSDKLCKKYKKLKHEKFAGFELWKQCLAGNKAAWAEMEKYNKHDVLALEELYTKLIPWASGVSFSVYHEGSEAVCTCGSKDFARNGFNYTPKGKFPRFRCKKCGAEVRGGNNLLSKEKKASILTGTAR